MWKHFLKCDVVDANSFRLSTVVLCLCTFQRFCSLLLRRADSLWRRTGEQGTLVARQRGVWRAAERNIRRLGEEPGTRTKRGVWTARRKDSRRVQDPGRELS